MIRELTYRLNDENELVLKATNKALFSMTAHVPAQELVKHIEFMRNLLASMVSDARRRKGGVGDGIFLLPGFNIPKGKKTWRIIHVVKMMKETLERYLNNSVDSLISLADCAF